MTLVITRGQAASAGETWTPTKQNNSTVPSITMDTQTIAGRNSGGNGSIEELTPAQVRAILALVIGTNVQAYNANLTTFAGIAPSANVQSVLSAADYAAIRTLLGLVIGTNVQAWDADLDAIAALATAAYGRSLLTASSALAARLLLKTSGVVYASHTTTQSPANTSENDLISHSLAAGLLANDGERLRWRTVFKTGANSENKHLKLYLGSTVIYEWGALALIDITFVIEIIITRTGAATQKVSIMSTNNRGTFTPLGPTYTTAAETLANALTLKAAALNGEGGGSPNLGDLTQYESLVEHLPAP
jgi:hypothetical protein